MAERNRDDRAIVIIGNRATVQPRVEWRTDFRECHRQPNRQRQSCRRAMQNVSRAAIELKNSDHLYCK
jgi:hypothetical protein